MTLSTETKKGLTCLVLGAAMIWAIVFIIKKEKNESDVVQPVITDESITIAVNAYKSGMDAGESKTDLDEINNELRSEFGLTVEFKSLLNKFYVRDLSGKKVKEV